MKQVTATAQTVDEAVDSAMKQLNASKDMIEVQVVDEGKKGFETAGTAFVGGFSSEYQEA